MTRSYTPPRFLFSPHLETIYPALLRRVSLQPYTRERITTPDDDFLDLDWLTQGSDKLVIISHGLEGNTTRAYIKGMARVFFSKGYDVLAWNYRGCSEEMNRQLRFYHSGATDDLNVVTDYAIDQKKYKALYLIGFSLGGNITLKYLGEKTPRPEVRKAVAISVPMDLQTSCEKISRPSNWIYANRFLRSLKKKVQTKAARMPGLDVSGIDRIKTLQQFDDRYTAPLHGFSNAIDYYTRCSSIHFVNNIDIPTLIINTLNDPFLSPECFPDAQLKDHRHVQLEILLRGGHVGFAQFNKNGLYWSEQRALSFIDGQ
ncbi:alpha/beta fold hydrolase [Fulvivirgaceae bacterium PWU4]|uniref:Alpha/beta fold hydrolase n=1 Tax=Chryseosolibacter histidini TaxID=2782349 RepID=A0AAP2DJH5_9BACT|nr:alpha/beta fold hydrolase [Chryseosolibacter histidini]MBT1697486.1 alpha/beta fold hydrolase [Chryseosolibacter histidini]